jgi:dienelactone hydrolase
MADRMLVAKDVLREAPFEDPDGRLARYFALEVERIERDSDLEALAGPTTVDSGAATAAVDNGPAGILREWRHQLLEMLGLDPLPERTPLCVHVTGSIEREDFRVEKLHFQSLPGLYVTGNLYLPAKAAEPMPAILYLCGHGAVRVDGVSFGNKVHYQHHGAWFARHGFVCLVIDSLQLGEIEGMHHGTYRYDQWWWLCRGYTPAGVEAWNSVRALDYLVSRKEVDAEKLGVTGRSGGGAYSWWIAAIDDRVRAVVPVAGITDLRNHVLDGCVDGHCDCMYFVNNYRWDYPRVAVLVAPRPLLISNTDRDRIFPLDGVYRTYRQLRPIYERLGAADRLGLHITAGPHEDTQELRIHAFRWMNQHLRQSGDLIESAARGYFQPPELKVFQQLPEDQINTQVAETFVAPALPLDQQLVGGRSWETLREEAHRRLRQLSFGGWPAESTAESVEPRCAWSGTCGPVRADVYAIESQPNVELPLIVLRRAEASAAPLECVDLVAADEKEARRMAALLARHWPASFAGESEGRGSDADQLPNDAQGTWKDIVAKLNQGVAHVVAVPRGVGPVSWSGDAPRQTRIGRRFYLLGQTVDGMRVWDLRRAIQAARRIFGSAVAIRGHGEGTPAGLLLYASLFEQPLAELTLRGLPVSHRDGPYFLSVQRVLDLPWSVVMAAERQPVRLVAVRDAEAWAAVLERLGQANAPYLPELVR